MVRYVCYSRGIKWVKGYELSYLKWDWIVVENKVENDN